MEQVIISFILEMAQKYPQLTMLFVVIGVFRSVCKPVFSLLNVFVSSTPTNVDDLFLAKIMGTKVCKGIIWLADYLMSIKIPGYDR